MRSFLIFGSVSSLQSGRLYFLADRVVEITADMFKHPRKLGVKNVGTTCSEVRGVQVASYNSLVVQGNIYIFIYMKAIDSIFYIMYLLYNGQMNGTWI